MLTIILAIYILIHGLIAIYDFSFYRIPNVLVASLLVLWGVTAPFFLDFNGILNSFIIFLAVLAVSALLFSFKYIGGGDAKYLAVASIWVSAQQLMLFFVIVTFTGAILAVLYLLLKDLMAKLSDCAWSSFQKGEERCTLLRKMWLWSGKGAELGKRESISAKSIPYGVAIAVGSILIKLL